MEGTASTVHNRFQLGRKAGVFPQLWHWDILQLHVEGKLNWAFQSLEGCQSKAPLGGERPQLLLLQTGANVQDVKEVEHALCSRPFLPPMPGFEHPQHFCADKDYDSKAATKDPRLSCLQMGR